MNKKNIITLAGDLASGKGTVSKLLADELNYTIYRNGEYFRKLAKEMNMSITEFNIYVESHKEIDIQVEKSAKEYAKDHDNLVIDARLGWFVVPESFKVYVKVDIDEAARRAFFDPNRKETEKFSTIEEQKSDLILRSNKEKERYKKVYGIDKSDMSNYDFIIDSTNLTPEELKNIIISEYKKWLQN